MDGFDFLLWARWLTARPRCFAINVISPGLGPLVLISRDPTHMQLNLIGAVITHLVGPGGMGNQNDEHIHGPITREIYCLSVTFACLTFESLRLFFLWLWESPGPRLISGYS